MKDGMAVVIDFKTGKPNPSHENQIKEYAQKLREMGYKSIRTMLLYTDPEVGLVEVE
jgi:RecB family endonuclease NucS